MGDALNTNYNSIPTNWIAGNPVKKKTDNNLKLTPGTTYFNVPQENDKNKKIQVSITIDPECGGSQKITFNARKYEFSGDNYHISNTTNDRDFYYYMEYKKGKYSFKDYDFYTYNAYSFANTMAYIGSDPEEEYCAEANSQFLEPNDKVFYGKMAADATIDAMRKKDEQSLKILQFVENGIPGLREK